jgi:hypothetical protein
MTVYAWPGFPVNRFEMRLQPNTRTFTGPYAPVTQTLDLLGERWVISLTLVPTVNDTITGAALEAFWDRLKAQANSIAIGHLKRPQPQGTLRGGGVPAAWRTSSGAAATWHTSTGATATWRTGAPVVAIDIPQLASTGFLRTLAGSTLLAGDQIGIGGQLVRIMANATADGAGLMAIEFQPRARRVIHAYSAVLWDAPTATFMLKPGTSNVPTSWTPGAIDGATVELIETY